MKLPTNKSLSGLSRALRNNGTKAEAILWRYLKKKQACGYQFHRQKVIGQYIVDFYCPKLAFIIELDGDSHDNKYEYDAKRDNYLKGLGLFVMRINNEDVLFHKDRAFYSIETYMLYKINEVEQSKHRL